MSAFLYYYLFESCDLETCVQYRRTGESDMCDRGSIEKLVRGLPTSEGPEGLDSIVDLIPHFQGGRFKSFGRNGNNKVGENAEIKIYADRLTVICEIGEERSAFVMLKSEILRIGRIPGNHLRIADMHGNHQLELPQP